MLLLSFTKNHNVIQIDNKKLTNVTRRYLIHESHEGTWSIRQNKWHNGRSLHENVHPHAARDFFAQAANDLKKTTCFA